MPVTRLADPRQVQRKSALVGADIERTTRRTQARRPLLRRLIVGLLIEKRAGLLPGIGVEVKRQPVQPELRGTLLVREALIFPPLVARP